MRGVLALHESAIETGVWDLKAAWAAQSEAWSALRTAHAAVDAEAWTEATAHAARAAAWAAARAAARAAEEDAAAYKRYAAELISLLKAAL
jgi:hypothetical protein